MGMIAIHQRLSVDIPTDVIPKKKAEIAVAQKISLLDPLKPNSAITVLFGFSLLKMLSADANAPALKVHPSIETIPKI